MVLLSESYFPTGVLWLQMLTTLTTTCSLGFGDWTQVSRINILSSVHGFFLIETGLTLITQPGLKLMQSSCLNFLSIIAVNHHDQIWLPSLCVCMHVCGHACTCVPVYMQMDVHITHVETRGCCLVSLSILLLETGPLADVTRLVTVLQ